MNKGLALIILGGLAVIGGAIFAAMVIRNKLAMKRSLEFDDFDYDEFDAVTDEELESFLDENEKADKKDK